MKRLFILWMMFACASIIHSAEMLIVQDVQVLPGESVKINVELNNTTSNLMGWQCDVSLPEGVALELKADGRPNATLGERFATTGHTILSSCLANGDYRFIATSLDGETIPGTTGTLFSVTLKADGSLVPGTSLTGVIKNIEFNTQDNQKVTVSDVTFLVTIPDGDVPVDHTPVGLNVADLSLAAGESTPVDVRLNNTATNLMGWQCDISLSDGLSLELNADGKPDVTLGERFSATGHVISSSKLANGDYRFIATSMNGEAIPGSAGTLFTVKLKADASLAINTELTGTIKNIEFNTQDNQKLTFDNASFAIKIGAPFTYCDFNGDGIVNALDIQEVINASAAESTDSKYDVNGDGVVNALDIQKAIVAAAATEARRMELKAD